MPTGTLEQSVRTFFGEYNGLWSAPKIDASRVALFYHAPCLTLRGDGSFHALMTRQEVEAFLQRVADTYKGEGLHHSLIKSFSFTPVGGRSAFVTIDWEMRRQDNSVIRGWRQSYNLVQLDER